MNEPLKLLDRLNSLQGNEVLLVYSPAHDRDFGTSLAEVMALLQPGQSNGVSAYIFSPVESLAALATLDSSDPLLWPDKWLIVVQGKGTYYLDRESTLTPNGDSVVAASVGRWIAAGTGGSGSGSGSGSGEYLPITGGTLTSDLTVLGNVTAVNFIKSSDARLKERVQPLQGALELLDEVPFYSYFLKNSPKMDYGVLAQELEPILPHLVETDSDGMKAVNYHALFVLMAQGLKEQTQRVAKLEKQDGQGS